MKFAQQFISGPSNQIRLQTYELTLDYVKQFFIDCDNEDDRFEVLIGLYSIMTISQSIIFVRVSPDSLTLGCGWVGHQSGRNAQLSSHIAYC